MINQSIQRLRVERNSRRVLIWYSSFECFMILLVRLWALHKSTSNSRNISLELIRFISFIHFCLYLSLRLYHNRLYRIFWNPTLPVVVWTVFELIDCRLGVKEQNYKILNISLVFVFVKYSHTEQTSFLTSISAFLLFYNFAVLDWKLYIFIKTLSSNRRLRYFLLGFKEQFNNSHYFGVTYI